MKKIAHIAGSIALVLSFNVGTVTTASANNNIRDFCRDAVEFGAYETMGQCQSNINKNAVNFCKEYSELAGFKNQGQCVKDIRDFYNDFKKS